MLERMTLLPALRATLLTAMTLLALPAAPASAQGMRATLPDEMQLARAGLVRQWFTIASLDPHLDQIGALTLIDGHLYVQTTGGVLQALNSETGQRLWVAQVGGPQRELFAVAANSTSLFVVNATDLYVLDKQTGTRLWQTGLQDTPSTSPTATETELFVPTFRGQLDVYSIEEQRISWYYATGATILSPPLAVLGNVAFANADGSLYVAHRDRRELIFRYHTDAPVSAPLGKIDNEWILLASEDYNVYCLHAANGRTRWRFAAEGPVQAAPTPIGGKIYVLPSGKGMFQIDAETGSEDWHSPHPVRFIAASPTRLYSKDRLENLVIVDRETGGLRGAVETNRFPLSVRNVENDRLFLASREGLIVCLREAQLDRPVPVEPETPDEAPPAAGDVPEASPPAQSP